MSNGVDFKKLALDLRSQLTTAQSELARVQKISDNYFTLYADSARELAALREELAKRGQQIIEIADQRNAAEQRNASLIAFANELTSAAFEGGSFDGGDIQDIAVKHGLMRIENRDDECGEACACREYGFPAECYRKTELIKPTESGASE